MEEYRFRVNSMVFCIVTPSKFVKAWHIRWNYIHHQYRKISQASNHHYSLAFGCLMEMTYSSIMAGFLQVETMLQEEDI
jgi:hypothetical protein